MDEERRQRLARNEAAFRKVNEAIEAGRQAVDGRERIVFVCECGALGCNDLLELSVDDYERVRAEARTFFVVPGHEEPEIEYIVARKDGYFVIRKREEEAGVAEATDPRS